MRVTVITIFPRWFDGVLATSVVARAVETGALEVDLVDLREFGKGNHRQIDDAPFGGGAGMVMMVEPLAEAIGGLPPAQKILFAPSGRRLDQAALDRWASMSHLVLICGRYEGIDERVAQHLVDEEVSLGDYVLPGGEAAAAAVIEGIARLLPGVVGNPDSVEHESFRDGMLEHPQYTRPASFRGWEVPEVLLSGDHARIAQWRHEQRLQRTRERRPDLLPTEPDESDPPTD